MISAVLAAVVYFNGQRIEATIVESNGAFYVTTATNVVEVAIPVAPTAPAPKPWVEPKPPPAYTAIRGRLTWQDNVFTHPPERGAEVWLLRDDQVAELAAALGGTADEPVPASKKVSFAKDKYTRSVADSEGRFGFDDVGPGSYTLIMQAKKVNGLAARDRLGKVRFKKIVLHPGEVLDASFDFGVSAYK